MKRTVYIWSVLLIVAHAGLLIGKATDSSHLLLIAVMTFLVLLALVVWGVTVFFANWKIYRWKAVTPLLVAVLGWLLLVPNIKMGDVLGDWNFRRNLSKYEKVVRVFEKRQIEGSKSMETMTLDPGSQLDVLSVQATKWTSGILVVEFLRGVYFPPMHVGYLYFSMKDIPEKSYLVGRWPHRRKICDHWYRVGD
jgi:hypothetical protein